jgi:putative tryptophan/tyrosine transport system substrate-binding protein
MRRREFITLLGGAAAAWPLAARAQQSTKLPTIGFLGANNATFERASTDAFVQRLRELGWIENRTVAIEYRWAEGRDGRFAEIAAEFIRLKVDVILTYATSSSIATKEGDSGYSDCVCRRRRPGRHGSRRFISATGRQHHGLVDSANRSCQQASRNAA